MVSKSMILEKLNSREILEQRILGSFEPTEKF